MAMADRPHLAGLLLRGERWMDAALRGHLRAAGAPALSRAHSLVFSHMDVDGGTRPAEIARRAGVTRQAIHQSVGELAELGLVRLAPDPANRRARLVTLTARGRRTVARARAAFADIERELARRIGAEQVRALRRALEADWGPPPGGG